MTQESFLDIEEEFYNLENLELLHVEVFFNELALYFGSKQNQKTGNLILYIGKNWEVLDSGRTKIDDSYDSEDIILFFNQLIGMSVESTKLFKDSLELFIEMSNHYFLHFLTTKKNKIELIHLDGESVIIDQETGFRRNKHTTKSSLSV